MTKAQLAKFKLILEAKAAELASHSYKRAEIAIEKHPDPMDEVISAAQRNIAISTLNRESQLLRQVREALGRIADGSFGICAECGEAINLKRLNAVPYAALCRDCQEQEDAQQNADTVSLEELAS